MVPSQIASADEDKTYMSPQKPRIKREALTVAAPTATMMSPVIENGHLRDKNEKYHLQNNN